MRFSLIEINIIFGVPIVVSIFGWFVAKEVTKEIMMATGNNNFGIASLLLAVAFTIFCFLKIFYGIIEKKQKEEDLKDE